MAATNKSIALDVSTSQAGVTTLLGKVQSALIDQLLKTGGLTLGSSSKPKLKLANTIYALVNGVMQKVTSAEYTVSGTVTNAKFNVYVIYINSAGTVATAMGTEGATIGAIVFPSIPANTAVIGFALVNPTGTGNFVGGTTDFDDGTVTPNAVYFDTVGPFNPNMLTL